MVDERTIHRAVELLREAAHPRRIILFGSHARGEAREDSDVDLLVIEDEVPDLVAEMVRLRRTLSPLRIPVDLLVVTMSRFTETSQTPGNVLHDAAQEGKVLYEPA